jgi:predicted membrane protein
MDRVEQVRFIAAGNARSVFTLAILVFVEASWRGGVLPDDDQRLLARCVVTIARRHLEPGQTMLVSSARRDDYLADILLESINDVALWPLHVSHPDSAEVVISEEYYKLGSYVIITTGQEDMEEQVNKLTDSIFWKNEACFVVVVTVCDTIPQLLALNLMRVLWDEDRVFNMLVVVQVNSILHMYTAFPYQSGGRCGVITDVVLLSTWNLESCEMFSNDATLFANKYPGNFHGCTVNVSTPYSKIAEDVYISEIINRVNVTVNYISDRPTDMSVSNRIISSLKEVLFGKSEIAVGGIPLVKDINEYLDPSFSYHEIKYTWYVPCAKPLSRLQRISKIFSLTLWIAVFVAFIIVAVVMWCVARRSSETRTYINIANNLLNIWAVCVGVSLARIPRTSRVRMLLFTWTWCCFYMSIVFQTFLTSYLIDPGFDTQIRTLGELLESGLKFGFRSDFDVYYKNSNYGVHQELLHRKERCYPPSFCVQRIINTRKYATLGESFVIENYLKTASNSNYVCVMNDMDAYPVKVVAYFSKGSIFYHAMNKILVSSVETGLITKILKTKSPPNLDDDVEEFFVFTLTHLSIAFYSLLLGLSLSFVLLLGEVIYRKFAT